MDVLCWAIKEGNTEDVLQILMKNPDISVNTADEGGLPPLHVACDKADDSGSVIPLLLAHPDIDVNVKDRDGSTPFFAACANGHTSCVRLLLKDSRVMVNEPDSSGFTPLWRAAYSGHLQVIKWWIASGRDIDLGTPGDVYKTDALGVAKEEGKTAGVTLLERFKSDPAKTRSRVRMQFGIIGQYYYSFRFVFGFVFGFFLNVFFFLFFEF